MKLLAFETATEACSVAVWDGGEVRERFEIAPRRHAELALPWAEALLADAGIARSQLDAIAVGRGPGAFTGVRLGVAIAQGIAMALDRPVVPVSTLAALAMRARPVLIDLGRDDGAMPTRIVAAIDARMSEVYVAAFEREGDALRSCSRETVSAPDAVEWPAGDDDDWYGVGTGFAAVDGRLATRWAARLRGVDAAELPHAADVARLAVAGFARGEAVAPERLEPAYLRDRVALTLAEQQALRAAR
jgi:tRNA threonylcarbamoyladenosine biosynthesis protein TsaB